MFFLLQCDPFQLKARHNGLMTHFYSHSHFIQLICIYVSWEKSQDPTLPTQKLNLVRLCESPRSIRLCRTDEYIETSKSTYKLYSSQERCIMPDNICSLKIQLQVFYRIILRPLYSCKSNSGTLLALEFLFVTEL